jgi:hypothetical protein
MLGSDKDFWVFIGTNTFHLVKKTFHSNRSINFLALVIFYRLITLTYWIKFIEKVFSFDNSKSKAVELFQSQCTPPSATFAVILHGLLKS